ncbi:MAG: radical SAM protein, partial [Lentisphaeria bacterium]|nr:radical SAM protein [Lentisphaeria bacterium]
AYGCPHNTCRFCGMYKTVKYQLRNENEVLAEIREAGKRYGDSRRIFLADGDVMAMPFDRLMRILDELNASFPRLARINLYANGSSILMKTPEQLRMMRECKVHTLYMGLESGSQTVLDLFGKTERAEDMITAVQTAQKYGYRLSVMILLGLGGKNFREEHISGTVLALNRMQPALLSALRYIRIPGLVLPPEYLPVSEYAVVEELRRIIAGLELEHTVFRANHTSNPLPLTGRFPADREKLLFQLDSELASGRLDREGPGPEPGPFML